MTAVQSLDTTGILNLSGHNLHGPILKALFCSLKEKNILLRAQGVDYIKELRLSECCIFDDDLEVFTNNEFLNL